MSISKCDCVQRLINVLFKQHIYKFDVILTVHRR